MMLKHASAIGAEIRAACPFLTLVSTPRTGVFSDPILDPDFYPDLKDTRGFYVPLPPPLPFRAPSPGTTIPILVGLRGGRQWVVRVLVSDESRPVVPPTILIQTFARLIRTDMVPFQSFPWLVATALPDPARLPIPYAGGRINLVGRYARGAVGQASLLLGRPAIPSVRPPVRTAMVIEAWDAAAKAPLESSRFLRHYADWESRAGTGVGTSGPVLPVLQVMGEKLSFSTGVNLELDPAVHASTVRELIDWMPGTEFEITQRDPTSDPIPTVRFTEPVGSVPDIRPAYPCPKCGKMEILKMGYDSVTGLTHKRTQICGIDIFPPFPDRIRDVRDASNEVIRP